MGSCSGDNGPYPSEDDLIKHRSTYYGMPHWFSASPSDSRLEKLEARIDELEYKLKLASGGAFIKENGIWRIW